MSKCRSCLKSGRNMISFDEKYIMYFNILTDLNLTLSSGDPHQLCKRCFKIFQQFIEFREKCRAANAVFTDVIPKESIKQEYEVQLDINSEVEVKQEFEINDQEAKTSFEDDNITDDYFGEGHNKLSYDNNLTYELVLKNEVKAAQNDESKEIEEPKTKVKSAYKKALNESNGASKDIKKTKRKRKGVKNSKGRSSEANSKSKDIKTEKTGEKRIIKYDMISETSLPCGLCTKAFEDNTQLDVHLSTHRQYNSCSICEEKFFDWQELMAHRVIHLPGKRIACYFCSKKFKTAMYMESHYRKSHHTEGERQKLRCRLCNNFFTTPHRLNGHVIETHNIMNKTFYCDYCNKLCTSKSILRVHLSTHSDNRPFSCDLCDSTFKNRSGLLLHKRTRHNPDRVYCMRCHKVFESQSVLDEHVCKHGDTICPVCGKICINRSTLTRHVRIHDKDHWYECDRCPARFRGRSSLAVHRDKHNGVPRHACEFCPAKFYFPSVLSKHRRTHTGIKPYVCKVCQKAFTGKNNLKVHMRVHGLFIINKKGVNDEVALLQQVAEASFKT